jgi:pilus assembly protein CpaB
VNPRQRRGAVLILLAAVGAVVVFVSISSYVADIRSQIGPLVTVLEVNADVPAFQPVTADAVNERDVPERWVPDGALRDVAALDGMVAVNDLEPGALLQTSMLRPPPEVADEQRELAIMVDAETGVAGKVGPGDRVDVYATFAGDDTPEGQEPPSAEIIVTDALVVDVGVQTTQIADEGPGGAAQDMVIPITFALPVSDSLVLAYAESHATNVRLGLKAPGSTHEIVEAERVYRRFEPGDPAGLGAVEGALRSALEDLEAAVQQAEERQQEIEEERSTADEEQEEAAP